MKVTCTLCILANEGLRVVSASDSAMSSSMISLGLRRCPTPAAEMGGMATVNSPARSAAFFPPCWPPPPPPPEEAPTDRASGPRPAASSASTVTALAFAESWPSGACISTAASWARGDRPTREGGSSCVSIADHDTDDDDDRRSLGDDTGDGKAGKAAAGEPRPEDVGAVVAFPRVCVCVFVFVFACVRATFDGLGPVSWGAGLPRLVPAAGGVPAGAWAGEATVLEGVAEAVVLSSSPFSLALPILPAFTAFTYLARARAGGGG